MIFRIEPAESGSYILDFAFTVIVFAFAQSRSAEVEAQHGKSKAAQRLHCVEYDFIVKRSTEQRMRMADYRCVRRIVCSRIQKSLEATKKRGGAAHAHGPNHGKASAPPAKARAGAAHKHRRAS